MGSLWFLKKKVTKTEAPAPVTLPPKTKPKKEMTSLDDLQYFTRKELACQHCGKEGMDVEFMAVVEELREELGFPFKVTSAYRCPEHPIEKKKSAPGTHTTGCAIDINVHGEQAVAFAQLALAKGIQRIGFAQKGPTSSRFIHIDDTDDERFTKPTMWSY